MKQIVLTNNMGLSLLTRHNIAPFFTCITDQPKSTFLLHGHTYSPTSHRLSSQPSGQKHWKELIPSMQVPPFLQGNDAQSLMSAGKEWRFCTKHLSPKKVFDFKFLPMFYIALGCVVTMIHYLVLGIF